MKRVFISYRRDGGEYLAGRLNDYLVSKKLSVFYDMESIHTGKFNEQIYKEIEMCDTFIMILSKDSLDRCVHLHDWLRLELAEAIKKRKRIIPVITPDFEFPEVLPLDIAEIMNYQGFVIHSNTFKEQADKLICMINERPQHPSSENRSNRTAGTLGLSLNPFEKKIFISLVSSLAIIIISWMSAAVYAATAWDFDDIGEKIRITEWFENNSSDSPFSDFDTDEFWENPEMEKYFNYYNDK